MPADAFDLAGALDRLGGDQELLRELVQFFLEDSPGLLDRLRDGLGAGHAQSVERAAHSLKGLAANFGATRAIDLAASIERLGRDGDLGGASQRFPELQTEIELLQQALAKYYQNTQ